MKHIVLHIGAAKCGSSSIQAAIKDPAMGVSNLMRGVLLKPRMIDLLNSEHPEQAAVDGMHQTIKSKKSRWSDKPLVLSHEVLFTSVHALGHLAAIARGHADRVTAVAYIRRQSDFLASAYGQWLFRFPERSAETAQVLRDDGLDPTLFWGVERHLIAAILSTDGPGQPPRRHRHIDWSTSVPERREMLAAHGASLSVGILPRAGYGPPLIEDFLTRIDLDPRALKPAEKVQNAAFAPAMTEAVLNAIEAGYAMPGPHEYNDFFENCGVAVGELRLPDNPFLARLKAAIDQSFREKNDLFAREFDFPEAYFHPDIDVDPDAVREEIFAVARERAEIPLELRERNRLALAMLAQIAWQTYQNRGQSL